MGSLSASSLGETPRNIGGLYQLSLSSSDGRHLPQRWTQLHVPHSGPPQYGVPTIHRLHKNASGPGAYSHHVSLIPAYGNLSNLARSFAEA